MNEVFSRAGRSLIQLIAAGALAESGLIDLLASDLNSEYVFAIYFLLVVFVQNAIEEKTGHAFLRTVDHNEESVS